MSKILYLFQWDPYLVHEKLQEQQSNFVQKYGPEALFLYTKETLDFTNLKASLRSQSLFSSQKLYIISGLPLTTDAKDSVSLKDAVGLFSDYLIAHAHEISSGTTIFFVSHRPDMKTKLAKRLTTSASKSDSCVSLVDLKANNTTIPTLVTQRLWVYATPILVTYLVDRIWPNLFQLSSECNKIITRATARQIALLTTELIDQIIIPTIDSQIFAMIHHIVTGHHTLAIEQLVALQRNNESPYAILWLMYRALKNIIQCVALVQSGMTSASQIASCTKISPFTLGEYMKHMKYLTAHDLRFQQLFSDLLSLEYDMKNWYVSEEGFWVIFKTLLLQVV